MITKQAVLEMATNVRDCAWPADVAEYMVLIEPMLRAYADTLGQKVGKVNDGVLITIDAVAVAGTPEACQVWLRSGVQSFQVGNHFDTHDEGKWFAGQLKAALSAKPAQCTCPKCGASSADDADLPCSLAEALNVIEKWADHGNLLHGDDIPRLRAMVNRIAPAPGEPV